MIYDARIEETGSTPGTIILAFLLLCQFVSEGLLNCARVCRYQ